MHGGSRSVSSQKDQFSRRSPRKTFEEFVQDSIRVHGEKYTYHPNTYVARAIPTTVTCSIHGDFLVTPNNHIFKLSGCPRCKYEALSLTNRHSKDEFVQRAVAIHGTTYLYDSVVYKNSHTHVTIVCPNHGPFSQTPVNHVGNRAGCPRCKRSKGEETIKSWLEVRGIEFEEQKRFSSCVNPNTNRTLRFDFFLPTPNLLIEYDGEQHSRPIRGRGGANRFEYTQYMDDIKNKYCSDQQLQLVRINYTQLPTISTVLEALINTKKESQ